MTLPVSPIRNITKMDQIQENDLYRAMDFQEEKPRYLHMSGNSLTTKQMYSWYGTKRQFRNLCKEKEWDALKLVSITKLRF